MHAGITKGAASSDLSTNATEVTTLVQTELATLTVKADDVRPLKRSGWPWFATADLIEPPSTPRVWLAGAMPSPERREAAASTDAFALWPFASST